MGTAWSEMHNLITIKQKAGEELMKANYPAYLKGLKS